MTLSFPRLAIFCCRKGFSRDLDVSYLCEGRRRVEQRQVKRVLWATCMLFPHSFSLHLPPSSLPPSSLHSSSSSLHSHVLPSSLLPSLSRHSFLPPPFTLTSFLPPSSLHSHVIPSSLPPFTFLLVPSLPSPSTSPGKWKDYPVGITGYSYLFGSVYMGLASLYFVMVGRTQEFKLPSKVSLVTSV